MAPLSFVLIGNEALATQCGATILENGHQLSCVVTRSSEVANWAKKHGIRVLVPGADLHAKLRPMQFDWLLSIANLSIVPDEILALPKNGSINFHDGPLPDYAGLNTPVWARINGLKDYGITWHKMESGLDEGDIIETRAVPIEEDDTAFQLNVKCFEAGVESFATLLKKIEQNLPETTVQDLSRRQYFSRFDRPSNAAMLDFNKSADEIIALVRGLDHGGQWNPLICPKIVIENAAYLVGSAIKVEGNGTPGEILNTEAASVTVACGSEAVRLTNLKHGDGTDLDTPIASLLANQSTLQSLQDPVLDEATRTLARHDAFWRRKLADMPGARLPLGDASKQGGDILELPLTIPTGMDDTELQIAIALWASRQQENGTATLALKTSYRASNIADLISPWVPLTVSSGTGTIGEAKNSASSAITMAEERMSFACDLRARAPELAGLAQPEIGLTADKGHIDGTIATVSIKAKTFSYDSNRLPSSNAELLRDRLNHIIALCAEIDPEKPVSLLTPTPEAELEMVVRGWNQTDKDFDHSALMHHPFEAMVQSQGDNTALVFEDRKISFKQLNDKADELAARLTASGIGTGDIVGLFVHRSPEMVVAAYAILKSGAAYLPLDPSYPADRTKYCLEDSQAKAVVTHSAVQSALPSGSNTDVITIDQPEMDPKAQTPGQNTTGPRDLCYMIYTSGSTGKPKGVMLEHRNVSNFFAGMDDRVPHDPAGTWLAVTSMSFDISVLEIFWTLGRGFKLVLTGDEGRTTLSNGPLPSMVEGMDISLYYWGNDDGIGRDKYKLLLEGSKFADQNGFSAVWTPERHFHAFGGPYPNPSVTGAAVAAVTQNLSVRAGSCVVPLHHTARIAEEWSVIDNLTNGRAGIGVASGWQPNDFVLRPENSPPNNKDAMLKAVEDLRKLWAGEPVAFPKADGTMHEVLTQPRPVSKRIPIWVTIAGNPETWREAGRIGAHVLTHLLGQSIEEVGEKIKIYHEELRAHGHNPDDFHVSLMLHTFISDDREHAREIARGPMKEYLNSAAGLIKQFAWAFPAFKRPEGVGNAFELDLGVLEPEELDAILEFAFLRYFEDSGLFGTVEDALNRIEQVKKIGVTEVACLIDYGIPSEMVLEGLNPLAEVVKRCKGGGKLDEGDFSVAAQIIRHKVTHMQCTPSMAQMFLMNDETRQALGGLKHILLGGEALPGALVQELETVSKAEIENMYGPTETTIWSTTQTAKPKDGTVSIGTPIANTRVYVLDDDLTPVSVGTPGELWIGGEGVARGYWQRPDLTSERFQPDPFSNKAGARMYRTGDLVAWRGDGTLDYLGRTDFQVKLRGYRIELGEIEAALDAQTDVIQTAVVVREKSADDLRLEAYFTAAKPLDEATLRSYLAKKLPPHMVPNRVIQLEHMPLTPNRKIDRKALLALETKPKAPAPAVRPIEVAAPDAAQAVSVDTAEIEVQIANVWRHVLGVQQIGSRDNFFDLGGHSLLAVQSHREIRANMGVGKLAITDIFRFPVLEDLANRIAALSDGGIAASNRTAPKRKTTVTKPRAATIDPAPSPANDTPKSSMRSAAMERRRAMRARRKG